MLSDLTPSTLSTCMYYTGLDPRTMEAVYVAKNPHEKAMQRALIQYRNPKNRRLVEEALRKAGREDLIGFDRKCLIRPLREGAGRPDAAKDSRRGKTTAEQSSPARRSATEQDSRRGKQNGPAKKKKKTIRNIHQKKAR